VKPKNARWPFIRRPVELLPSILLAALTPIASAQVPRLAEDTSAATAAAPQTQADVLYLEVILNHMPQPDLLRVRRRDSLFAANAIDLRRIGFTLEGATGEVVLNGLPGVSLRYDGARQQLWIEAPLTLLSLPLTRIGPGDDSVPVPETHPGLVLDYDMYASHAHGGTQFSLGSSLRIFGRGRSVFENTAMSRAYRDRGGAWRSGNIRLDTSWQWSFPESAVSVVAGDAYSGFLDWTRPVRFAGVQVGRNFALQPYRITSPLPSFLGEAAVPSSVELYVNGIRQAAQDVPAGPFQLTTVPGITGAGTAQMVVTDAFGRVRTLEFPFYATQRLLARGLSDWSASLGVVREDYGVRSFAYADEPIASATLRYGLHDRFTIEAHAETGDGLVNGGAGGAWLLGQAGVLAASHARSTHDGAHGSQTVFGYDWNGGPFHLSLESRRTHGRYQDVAALYGPLPPRLSERMLLGWSTPSLGSFSLNHVRLAYPDADMPGSRFAGVSWARGFRGWSVHASWNRDLDNDDNDSLHLALLIPLGDTRQLSTSWQRRGEQDDLVLDAMRPVPGDGGYGWRAQLRGGDLSGGSLEASWLGDHGRLVVGAADLGDGRHAYAQLGGSVVVMGGRAFLGRDIHDGFAIVSTGGIAGVPVKRENRVVGVSDEHGMLLVTGLNAWQRNRLSIDPMDLPADLRVTEVDLMATPSDRAGMLVRFSIQPVRAALVILQDAQGKPLPAGSRVRLAGSPEGALVGYDGETYLEGLGTRAALHVDTVDGPCTASFDYPDHTAGTIPRIGPVPCLAEER
jgi:outer membrane usher protein